MAMLAEPRRKQKVINLRAKNSAWSNDSNKFGQRMLEKMGWSSGKGLGAKENGIVEHVVARYKNDEKGLGFEDRNDQWTKHEDDFNSLLANLSNGDNNEEKLHSGVSLEDKSKKSKARVHYHKYTRGKDLTRYSEKDLANIFGKKSLKNEAKVEEILKDDLKTTEQVFTEKGSMEDYFKNKLAALKSNNKLSPVKNIKKDDEADYNFCGFAGTNNGDLESDGQQDTGFQGFSFYNTNSQDKKQDIDEQVENVNEPVETEKSKKKRKSKNKSAQEDIENQSQESYRDVENIEHLTADITEEVEPIKKKKSKKKYVKEGEFQDQENDVILENTVHLTTDTTEEVKSVRKKKSKKNKQEIDTTFEEVEEKSIKKKTKIECKAVDEHVEEDYHVPKKKKKRKNKDY